MIARRGNLILGVAIVAVAAAVGINIAQHIKESHWKKRDRHAFRAWAATHGGKRAYGLAWPEPHSRYDVICAPHFPGVRHSHADYKIYLLVDSHGKGQPRVVRAVQGPLRPKATDTGPRCGAPPAAP